jgi:hypothetical protein
MPEEGLVAQAGRGTAGRAMEGMGFGKKKAASGLERSFASDVPHSATESNIRSKQAHTLTRTSHIARRTSHTQEQAGKMRAARRTAQMTRFPIRLQNSCRPPPTTDGHITTTIPLRPTLLPTHSTFQAPPNPSTLH